MGFVLLKKRRLHKAEQSFMTGKRKQAIQLAKPLLNAKDKEIAHAANRISGLALYKRKKFKESLPCLEMACQLGHYQHDWYNYAMSLAYSGDVEKAEEAFQNVYRSKVQPGYVYTTPLPIMLFQYLKGLIHKGFTTEARIRANEMKQMYAGIGVLNGHNERSKGLPPYHRFREQIESLYQLKELAEWEKKNWRF